MLYEPRTETGDMLMLPCNVQFPFSSIGGMLRHQGLHCKWQQAASQRYPHNDIEDRFESIVEANDMLLERIVSVLLLICLFYFLKQFKGCFDPIYSISWPRSTQLTAWWWEINLFKTLTGWKSRTCLNKQHLSCLIIYLKDYFAHSVAIDTCMWLIYYVLQDSQLDEILCPSKANKPLATATAPVTVSIVSTWNKQTVSSYSWRMINCLVSPKDKLECK